MGSMLRSDLMSRCDVYLQPETAFDILAQLGELGCVQFTDMTPNVNAFQRNYVSELRRCIELDRKLRYMKSEMTKDDIHIPTMHKDPKPLHPNEINVFETMLEKLESDIQEMQANQVKLIRNHMELLEIYYVLTHIGPILGDVELRRESLFLRAGGDVGFSGRLVVKTGVVWRVKSFPFEMMLWRVSRGNIYYRTAAEDKTFEDPITGMQVRKVAFLSVCQGEQLNTRLEKICTGFRVNTYPCPRTYDERMEMIKKLVLRLSDLEQVLKKTKYHRCKALRAVGKQWPTWVQQVRKAKAIYHTMNLFSLDITRKCLIGQCWVPDDDMAQVRHILEECSVAVGTNVSSFMSKKQTTETPPTYHRTNKFTNGFQLLINAYGDSIYRELNPGLYAIITFPFLFSVMFGDMGHGLIMLSFASWMVINEKKFTEQKSQNEIWNIFFGGRYIILLMSMFTLYTGFLYNDIFAKPFALRDSYWVSTYTIEDIEKQEVLLLDPRGKTRTPYFLGIDPAWKLASNKILFDNSIKMKMSIIIGVIHMMFGLCLSLVNHLHFKRYHAVFLEFIPQVLFLVCLFMWLVFMIYFKWFKYYAKKSSIKLRPGCAPLILILFIDMALVRTTKVEDTNCDAYMFKGQQNLQRGLLIVALLSVPVLLFGSPIYLNQINKRKRAADLTKKSEGTESHGETFGDLMIHQGVHTIEFVLSTISHTASYLRLWALSLAHSELAEMLWNMILSKLGLRSHSLLGSLQLFVIFAIWACFSVSILVIMEGLSAFLHTLRLHWVEFMSKFYSGGGCPFCPFNFRDVPQIDIRDEKIGGKMRRSSQ